MFESYSEFRQTTDHVLMVEPAAFYGNPATAIDNFLQKEPGRLDLEVHCAALSEFHGLREALQERGIKVSLFKDSIQNHTPDSLFANNWFSTHEESYVCLYPMKADNRRKERRPDIVRFLQTRYGRFHTLEELENQGQFLEGTGSLVLDRINKVAYAALSQRTHKEALLEWARLSKFEVIMFQAADERGVPVFHTSCVLGIGTGWSVICPAAIADLQQRSSVLERLRGSQRAIIEISLEQMRCHCASIIELKRSSCPPLIVMSRGAHDVLSDEQKGILSELGEVCAPELKTIERYGGGSARCLLAELF